MILQYDNYLEALENELFKMKLDPKVSKEIFNETFLLARDSSTNDLNEGKVKEIQKSRSRISNVINKNLKQNGIKSQETDDVFRE